MVDQLSRTSRLEALGGARLAWIARLDDRTVRPLGLALAVAVWFAVVAMSEPYGRLWGTGQDARCYWVPTLSDPYRLSSWNDPIAYVYSPAFLQLVSPLTALPWQGFIAVWTALLLAAVRFLTGPRLLILGVGVGAMEVAGGNISLLLAVAIVLGFRWPAAWALVLLTKVTPGVGLVWFAVRREWRSLGIAVAATVAVAGLSALFLPTAWREWVDVLIRIAGSGREGTWASLPVPFVVRLPIALAVVVWGARTDRYWTVPVASMIALPALWYGSLSMLLAVLPLRHGPPGAGRPALATTDDESPDRSRSAEPSPARA
jgi:hypothetical protein